MYPRDLTAIGIIFLILLTGSLIGALWERHDWHGGRCPACGHPWRYFDTDSQGGRGYACDGCEKTIWISWPVDRQAR